jgi:hypothetical protein
MGTVNDEVICERNRQDGDLNIDRLAEHLEKQLNIRSCKVDSIRIKGEPLQPVSKIAQIVAWADDLDDAIGTVRSFKEHMASQERDEIPHAFVTNFSAPTEPVNQTGGGMTSGGLFAGPAGKYELPGTFSSCVKTYTPLKRKAEPSPTTTKAKHKPKSTPNSNEEGSSKDRNSSETTDDKDCSINLTEKQRIDIEVAKRMVMRQVSRKAYCKVICQ